MAGRSSPRLRQDRYKNFTSLVTQVVDPNINHNPLAVDKSTKWFETPDFFRSFEDVVSGYTAVMDYGFGTANTAGKHKIKDAADLGAAFNPYSQNANQIVINNEVQRYMPFSSNENFVFATDALELTASLHNPPSILSPTAVTAVGDVNESRTVVVNDASQLKVGQIMSIDPDNLHFTAILGLYIAPVAGNKATLTIGSSVASTDPDWFATVTIIYTAIGGESHDTVAQWFVDQVNANATLSQRGISAVKPPAGFGALMISWPQRNVPNAPQFGQLSNGSISQFWANASYSGGGMQFWVQNRHLPPAILAKNGNTLTLSCPVSLANGETLQFQPTYLLMRADNYAGPTSLYTFSDASMATLGQVVSFGWGDSNYHRVTASTPTTITIETAAAYLGNGREFKLLPFWQWPVSAAVNNTNVLPFSALPYGAVVGMLCIFPSGNWANANTPCYVTAVDTVAKTVTISSNVTLSSGNIVTFAPPVQSGQIWSKFIVQPGELGRDWVAVEWEVDLPPTTSWANWPALWQYTDTTDPNPGPGSGGDEIDILEVFTYSANEAGPGNPKIGWNGHGYTGTPYRYPTMQSSGILLGNSIGKKTTRKFAMIWSASQVYYYIDGVLVGTINKTWNNYKRPQFVANLAVGSFGPGSNNGNGFIPIDMSSFPMKFRIKRFRMLTWPEATPVNIGVY